MPGLGRRKRPEVVPDTPESLVAPSSLLGPQELTSELLDWLIHALTAVLRTYALGDPANKHTRQALANALKQADRLHLSTTEAIRRAAQTEPRSAGGLRTGD